MSNYKKLIERTIKWLFPWIEIKEGGISHEEFIEAGLSAWIMPNEFSFGPDGWFNGLQPTPFRYRAKDVDVSVETHELRSRLAMLRRRLNVPPHYWMMEKPIETRSDEVSGTDAEDSES